MKSDEIGATSGETIATSDTADAQATPAIEAVDGPSADGEAIKCCGPGEACGSPTCTGTPLSDSAPEPEVEVEEIVPSKYEPEPEPEVADFAKVEDFSALGGKASVTIGEIVETVVEMAASSLAEPPQIDDTGEGIEDVEPEQPVSARKLAEHMEQAPRHVELPEGSLPPGTDIHVEMKGLFVFKLPGQPAALGRGRTIYGAMVNAGILR